MAKFTVDFSETGEGSSSSTVTPGKYTAVVEAISVEEGAKAKYLKWNLKITSGSCKGLHINHITSLASNALFNLRDTLIALGVKVPKSAVAIDPDKFVNRSLGIEVILRNVDGKEYPNVKRTFPVSELSKKDDDLPFDVSGVPSGKAVLDKAAPGEEVTIELD